MLVVGWLHHIVKAIAVADGACGWSQLSGGPGAKLLSLIALFVKQICGNVSYCHDVIYSAYTLCFL